jgi:hypothetical protein
VDTTSEPELPAPDAPLLSDTPPLPPAAPPEAEPTLTEPLEHDALAPVIALKLPPVSA